MYIGMRIFGLKKSGKSGKSGINKKLCGSKNLQKLDLKKKNFDNSGPYRSSSVGYDPFCEAGVCKS